MWLWDSPHQTTETLSYKREAAGTAVYSFKDTSCALHGQNSCYQATQRPWNVLTNGCICGASENLSQTDSLLKMTRIYSVSQKPRISHVSWHGAFQSPGRHSLSEVLACPNPVHYWQSSGAARCQIPRHTEKCKCHLCGCRHFIRPLLINSVEIRLLCMTARQGYSGLNRLESCHLIRQKSICCSSKQKVLSV